MGISIRLRRGTRADWIIRNPVLKSGEPGLEIDTNRVKFGDGVTEWMLLPYFGAGEEIPLVLDEHINSLTPHPVYDDAPSLVLLYQNAKV